MSTKMRILLIGDASNYHRCLGDALKRLGHDVTVASTGMMFQDTHRDIDLRRGRGRLSGAWLYLRLLTVLRRRLSGYDVVQLCGTGFVDLKPKRQRAVLDMLCRNNKAVYLTLLGMDSYYVQACAEGRHSLRYTEWRVGNQPTEYALTHGNDFRAWTSPEMQDYCRYVYSRVRGGITALYEYNEVFSAPFAGRLSYAGIPVDMDCVEEVPFNLPDNGPVRVMVAYGKNRMTEKGTHVLLPMLRRIAARHPHLIQVVEVHGLTYAQFVETLKGVHVVVDQLYSYTPATTALLAMAMGKVAVSGAEEEYYHFIAEDELRPIFNADPFHEELTEQRLEALLLDRPRLRSMAAQGRRFVSRHNDSLTVARRFLRAWQK